MVKFSEKNLAITSLLLFAFIYITVHTDAVDNFFIVLRPFINGFILAYLTLILAAPVEKKLNFKYARGISVVIVYLFVTLLLTVMLVYIVPILTQNIQRFMRALPTYLQRYELPNADQFLGEISFLNLTPNITGQIANFTGYARAATTSIINGVLSFVVSIYVIITQDAIKTFIYRLTRAIMPNKVERLRATLRKSHIVFQQFLVAQLFASLILGILAGIVLSLIGVEYAVLIGTILGISNIIPLFGAVVGVAITTAILFLTNSPILATAGFVFLLFLQQLDATIITPKMMGNALNLNPIVIILVLAVGTNYFGFIGILFAVPIAAIICEIVKERLQSTSREIL